MNQPIDYEPRQHRNKNLLLLLLIVGGALGLLGAVVLIAVMPVHSSKMTQTYTVQKLVP